ncbi:multidrug resistance-associated protein 1-like isoform X2 [Hyposmocoma kahamanoa]|uniref:multidrug resistance-associated protein 1-like isoform X2 n=1 Tax=Hyposmocoma kahamanoa TaxID=1477025 RepID=UPI000E6DA574|nr:multidrug resistance-associated protein 1-like isoform X2 [Hyposmocoma kahamanoa]
MSCDSTLEKFCGSAFWDSNNLTWHTENPDLTPCVEKTILVWMPCIYLWVASLLEAYYIFNSKERNIPWNILNVSKLSVTCLLIVLQFVDMSVSVHRSSQEVPNNDYYCPVIKLLTFGLSATLLYYNRRYGMRASGVLFFFWLLLVLAGLPQLRTEIRAYSDAADDGNVQYSFVSYILYYPLIFLMFILNCFADLPPKDTPYKFGKNPCPESASGFPSRLTFSWFDPLAITGFRRSLTESDLWALNPPDSSKEVVPRFEKYWHSTLEKREATNSKKATYSQISASMNFKPESERKPASVLPALCLAFGAQFLFGSVLKLINDILTFVSPQLLGLLISFIESKEPVWKGYVYAVALLACASAQTIVLAHYFTRMYLVGMRIKTAVTCAVYRKSLRMSCTARKESTIGEIVNLMSIDAPRFLEFTAYVNLIWSAPLQIALAVFFLWGILGPSVLAGLAVIIIFIPINGLIINKVEALQVSQMQYKDERVKLMNEVLNGIKVLKMYAWEPSFEDQILKIRNKEINIIKRIIYLNSVSAFISVFVPFLVTLLSFACFVLVNDTEVLDSKKAFVALSLFNIMRFPLYMLPNVISSIVEISVVIKRLNKFMNCDELNVNSVEHDPKEPNPILIESGHFSWGDEPEPTLRNININIKKGSLVAVVGAVGSGKSSLLSALLGEMNKVSGRVNTTGKVAYVPQQAWIQNATLQDNIVFGKQLDKLKYNNVIDVCALKSDFDVLPGGDQTEIGEKGINLSGGQKQRVSLARAVYFDADNYFLDDPLSAVDSHVGKHIFDKVVGPNGLLKTKTRVWVTHSVTYLAQADLVLVLKKGQISEAGTYQGLLEKKGAFADFLIHHLSIAKRTSPEELNEIKQDLKSKLGSEFQIKLQRARSLSESAESKQQQTEEHRANNVERQWSSDSEMLEVLKAENKLIEEEKTETGSVKWSVYKYYLTSLGVLIPVMALIMNVVVQALQIGSNFWLVEWSNDDQMIVNGSVDTQRRDFYIGVYAGLGAAQVISTFFANLLPFLACWRAAKILHMQLLGNILKTPIQFFEKTPLGRILARFSKDVDVLDTSLPDQIENVTNSTFEVLSTLFVVSLVTPIFLVLIIPIGVIYYIIQRFYVATSRQLNRLESISKSPIYSHLGESISGATTIRAYGVTQR